MSFTDTSTPKLVAPVELLHWLTPYLTLIVEVDGPIIEALSVYWKYVKRRVAMYNIKEFVYPPDIDPVILRALLQRNGIHLRQVPLRLRTPELCRDAMLRYPLALEWVPNQTKEMCKDALARADPETVLKIIRDPRPKYYMEVVTKDSLLLRLADNQSNRLCMAAVQQNGQAVRYVKHQTEKICMAAVKQDGMALQWVRVRSYKVCVAALQQNGEAIRYAEHDHQPKYPEFALIAIGQNPYVLSQIPLQLRSFDMCSAAVSGNGLMLQYVPTGLQIYPELCLQAVTQNGLALEFVVEKTPALCAAAVTQTWRALTLVPEPTAEMYMTAALQLVTAARPLAPQQQQADLTTILEQMPAVTSSK